MLVWTHQPLSLYEKLLVRGVIHCDPDHEEFGKDYVTAYKWIAKQMEYRIGKPPKNVRYPFWAWALLDGNPIKKPDLRRSEFNNSGTVGEQVLIELEIPDTDVLLSDEENWHYVLNNWYLQNKNGEVEADMWFDNLSADEQEPIVKEALYTQEKYSDIADTDADGSYDWLMREKVDAWLKSLPPNERVLKERKSWEKIFDKDDPDNDWEFVQATFWELRAEQVKSVRQYTGLGTNGALRIIEGGRADKEAEN